jgi:dual specificity tyrosine-phosphorylation-regulated kinase 2/3/4
MAYIKRQQARKLANGAKKEELDELLKFPEPSSPVPAQTPNGKSYIYATGPLT